MQLRLREIPLALGEPEELLPKKIAKMLGVSEADINAWKIVRKGIDARKKPNVLRVYTVDFLTSEPESVLSNNKNNSRLIIAPQDESIPPGKIKKSCRVVVVGMGPAGLFSALSLAERGAQVVLIERGRRVEERLTDVYQFWNNRLFNPESNIQFGEGGAGTFSDGKLTSRINNPWMKYVLETLVRFSAPDQILWQAKPHVGSDRLRAVLIFLRKHLQELGVDIRFSSKLTGIECRSGSVEAVVINEQERLTADYFVLALGHSARDSYQMLNDNGVKMEAKAFAIGVRVEHPLELINSIQYGMKKHPELPAAEYSLTWNNKKSRRGSYSFCMCPGGEVVNAASASRGIVVNGLSLFKRENKYSNSALVVAVRPEDFSSADSLAGVRFQEKWEQRAFDAGGADWSVPAQPLLEFQTGKGGRLFSSCRTGIRHADLSDCLPDFVVQELRLALPQFEQRMKGFVSTDACLTGVETRTSSPIRIVRNPDCESVSHKRLYPAGEGAGYAGGIMSSAVDGLKVAEAIIAKHSN